MTGADRSPSRLPATTSYRASRARPGAGHRLVGPRHADQWPRMRWSFLAPFPIVHFSLFPSVVRRLP
ncbi:MAG: hypothetical protein OZSIB_1579 [Candidatus Ozemobacter sibiricus]|uniref:Uncharacterized protein n=1 Tax=Candidatus Ozemobacter sibiricus TaxID=2268124 RepID=A0A367ZKF2_9BACT|nr:MAG: hypothetical protein OZSIB_1579 [Candidatus Ozemobacter sibiricus]